MTAEEQEALGKALDQLQAIEDSAGGYNIDHPALQNAIKLVLKDRYRAMRHWLDYKDKLEIAVEALKKIDLEGRGFEAKTAQTALWQIQNHAT